VDWTELVQDKVQWGPVWVVFVSTVINVIFSKVLCMWMIPQFMRVCVCVCVCVFVW
jgi:hypothetical protein